MAARRRTTVRVAALPLRGTLPELGHLIPSFRSLGIGLLLALLAALAYVGARETSVFAVQTVDVRGGTPVLRAQVRAALADVVGTSLLKVGGATVESRLSPIPGVRSFTYDRSFPHTLRVVFKREVPVLVVRRVPGDDALLVAASGRVIKELPHPRLSHLPRLWVKKTVPVTVGAPLSPSLAGAAGALAALHGAGLPGGVSTVTVGDGELSLHLSGGLEVRLGDTGDLRLKLAIARRILRLTRAATAGGGYLDVSLPERPVLDTNPQVGG
ncbi:MAG TPA: FtsQ-type POTRA domain-containing protein [Gaiellaceae bacterium]|nr:FtsQ-type POTRA domain-containing protein [Gaiellaceae bacterium]